MASRIHSILPRVGLAMVPLSLLAALAYLWHERPYEVPPGQDIFTVVQGTWAWTTADSNCATVPHTITFTPDHTGMIITAARPYRRPDGRFDSVAFYDIRAHTRGSIRGAIRGETRRTEDGDPVVWDLVLKSPDRYAWHRTDWMFGICTRDIRRCPPGKGRAGPKE